MKPLNITKFILAKTQSSTTAPFRPRSTCCRPKSSHPALQRRSRSYTKGQHKALIAQLRRDYAASHDIAEHQRIHEEIKKLESEKIAGTVEVKIEALKDRIAKIRKENHLKREARQREIELKNQQEMARLQETRFTGIFSCIEFWP